MIDWSRQARNTRKLAQAADDCNQTCITDYYTILDRIQQLTIENKKLAAMLEHLTNEEIGTKEFSFTPVLKSIISNAEKNATQFPKRRRYPEILKKFCTSLLIYSGPLAYEFMQQNLPQALPCIRTVQEVVHSEYKTISEGDFRFDDLLQHIKQHKAPMEVSVAEDATRVIARVEYDHETDRCVGFVLPMTEKGVPIAESFRAVSFSCIESMFSDNEISRYAYVYMVQPLSENIPPFCLACVGTNNKFTFEIILNRWKYIFDGCKKKGIHVVSYGSDGDSRLLKAMQIASALLPPKCDYPFEVYSSLDVPKIPLTWKPWFYLKNVSTITHVQDVVHIAVKLKCRLLKPSVVLPMGDYVAGSHHVRIVCSLRMVKTYTDYVKGIWITKINKTMMLFCT